MILCLSSSRTSVTAGERAAIRDASISAMVRHQGSRCPGRVPSLRSALCPRGMGAARSADAAWWLRRRERCRDQNLWLHRPSDHSRTGHQSPSESIVSPKKARRPCLVCNRPTDHGSRCPPHCIDNCHSPYTSPLYRQAARQLMSSHLATLGFVCPGADDLDHPHPPHKCRTLSVDHVIPVRLGGDHSPQNLRVLCSAMNSSRNA